MGNCCGAEAQQPNTPVTNVGYQSGGYSIGKKPTAFQGEGHRLGTAEEQQQQQRATAAPPQASSMDRQTDELPKPMHDPALTQSGRDQQRADRLAAAEARMKKQKQPRKTKKSAAPLNGPNSEPLMRWGAG